MIANYVNEQHDTWDQFLREFAYAIRTAVNETTGKTPAELFLGRKLITPFQKLVMVSDGTEFAVGDIERLFEEARRNTKAKHEKWEKYYNRRRRDVQTKVRIYRHRKCDETEIRTGSSDNGSLRDETISFDRGQRRSNESQYDQYLVLGLRKVEGLKEAKMKLLDIGDHVNLGRVDQKEKLGSFGKVQIIECLKDHCHQMILMFCKNVSTNRYNLRPRGGREVESPPAMEMKTQQGGPGRSRKGRARKDSPYIDEQTRSSNKNARRGGDQQRQDQERKGACTRKSLSLEDLVGNANYKS
ncbi:uncharacterized protein TNCV_1107091 [Trichonephila clavipes]|nr:uncharacterized protein TNCV_1107091 [Trichonephila clavipes]